MKRSIAVLGVLLAVSPAALAQAPAAPTGVRTIAIADFVDDSTDGSLIGAGRLNALLQRILSQRAAGRLMVVATDDVRAAMRAQGFSARDLVSPTKAIAVAQAVGAEWIVTGRWMHLDTDTITRPDPGDPAREIIIAISGHGLLELRVLEAATRRIVMQDSVGADSRGFSPFHALLGAAQRTLLHAADRLLRL